MAKHDPSTEPLDERIRAGARWLLGPRHDSVIHQLQVKFSLTPQQAVLAIRLASEMRRQS